MAKNENKQAKSAKNPMDAAKKAKFAAIQTAIKQLEKQTKKEGIVQIMGDNSISPIECTPTGSLMFDIALGNGLPKGRIIEFFGAESSGKTLCATKAMAEVQKAGGVAALIDAEYAFDPSFAAKLGLNPDELIISQPEHMQEAFTIIDALIDSGGIDIIVVDSVAALVPKEELEGDVGKQSVGLVARHMSQFLRRITGKASEHKCTVIFINQIRDAIGVMYGDPTTTPGGKALKFYCSVRVQIARVGGSQEKVKIGGEEVVVGHTIRATIKKNKVAPPFRKAEFNIYYDGRKTDPADEIAAVALLKGLIPKYAADGTISATGRTYRLEVDGETLEAKKKDDVASELRKCPKVQEYLIDIIKNGTEDVQVYEQEEFDSEMSDEDFERMALEEAGLIKNGKSTENEAEETSGGWDDI